MWCLHLTLLYLFLSGSIGRPQEAEEQKCTTTSDSIDPGSKCVFPFTHNGLEYVGCPPDPIDTSRRWCSTETDGNGEHVSGSNKYGFCSDKCPISLTTDDVVLVEDALEGDNSVCDFKACNGMVIEYKNSTGIDDIHGQCNSLYGKDGAEGPFCFVNEESICEKVPYPLKPSAFASVQPCQDPRAPKPRYGGGGGSSRPSSNSGFFPFFSFTPRSNSGSNGNSRGTPVSNFFQGLSKFFGWKI